MARTRIYADLSLSTLRKLLLWAASRDSNRTQWLKTVLVLRIEENFPKVEAWLESEAKNIGVSREELEKAILSREKFDFEAYRKELLSSEPEKGDK